MSMAYIREYYRVLAKRGGRVVVDGKPGVIAGSRGPYLKIRRDGEDFTVAAHPTWRVQYLASDMNDEVTS